MNGPINIVKLSNKNKSLYLFFDIHEDIQNQSQCLENESMDIDYFFSTYLKKAKSNVDFFLEIGKDHIDEYKNDSSKSTYLTNVQKWFSRNYDIVHNKIIQSKKYPKVRFHTMDIRESFNHLPISDFYIGDFINDFKENMNDILIMIKDNPQKKKKDLLIHKIISKYNHSENKEIINKYIKTTFIPFIEKSLNYVNKKEESIMLAYTDLTFPSEQLSDKGYGQNFKIFKKAETKLEIFSHKLFMCWLDSIVVLTDLYFIRRFIDKNYIKNGILYAGSYHCLHIIYVLVHFFDFEIENVVYSKVHHKKLNNIIKKSVSIDPYKLTKCLLPPEIYQCVPLPDWLDF